MNKAAIAALAAVVVLVIVGLRAADVLGSRTETLNTAESRAANLASILSHYIQEALAGGDAALRQLALHGRRIGGPAAPADDWIPSLASARAGLTGIGAISVVDREGIIRHSTQPVIVGQSRRDDYVVRQALSAPGDDLIVGTPVRAQVAPGGFLIPLGRRLTRADGTVDGAVVASFIPSAMREFFATVDIGARGTVSVFHPDGVVLFREPSPEDPLGQPARQNPVFVAASAGRPSGVLRAPLEPGGPVFLSAYQTGTATPLTVAVSVERSEVLAEWRRLVIAPAAVSGALLTLLVGTLVVLLRQTNAKVAAEQALVEARRLEAELLREANQRLEAALEREKSARRDAETASALKDQFLMTVSHELRTPLMAISGWARLLVDGFVNDNQKESALLTIERNALAQTRLIEDLLDMSRIISGKLRLDVHEVDIAAVVKDAVQTLGPAARAKEIAIKTAVDPAAGWLTGDAERLQQIVWNLLSNAVKFTPKGGRVDLTVSRRGSEVEIVVTDTGCGISADFLPHVFERFRQEDAGTTRRHGGLGLGLAIVRHLVELHGGSVMAQSDGQGRGATFRVSLPRGDARRTVDGAAGAIKAVRR